jgi:hypothetical protein
MCKDLLGVPIYGPREWKNCIMVLIEAVNEDYEQHKLFYLVPSTKYYELTVGIKVF